MSRAARPSAAASLADHAAAGPRRRQCVALRQRVACMRRRLHRRSCTVAHALSTTNWPRSRASEALRPPRCAGGSLLGANLPTVIEGSFALAVLRPQRTARLPRARPDGHRAAVLRRAQWHAGFRSQRTVHRCTPRLRSAYRPAIGVRLSLLPHDSRSRDDIPRRSQVAAGRVPASSRMASARRSFYWRADYRAEPGKDFTAYRTEFRDLLAQSVGRDR